MRESCTYGFVRGARGNSRPFRVITAAGGYAGPSPRLDALASAVGGAVERTRHFGDDAVERALLLGGIFDRDVAPLRAVAGQHRLAIEQPAPGLVGEARHRDGVALAAEIGHVLALDDVHFLDMLLDRLAADGVFVELDVRIAFGREEALALLFG